MTAYRDRRLAKEYEAKKSKAKQEEEPSSDAQEKVPAQKGKTKA